MSANQLSKKHHFNPRRHLQRFVDETGNLLVYDLDGEFSVNPLPQKPVNTGFERWLYSPEDEGEQKDDRLEAWLARNVDGPGAEAVTRVTDGNRLSDLEARALATYIAAQDLRTPASRDRFVAMAQAIADRKAGDVDRLIAQLDKRMRDKGAPLSDEQRAFFTNALITGGLTFEVQKGFWLQYLETNTPVIAELIPMVLEWTVERAPDGMEFLMSDAVLTKGRAGFADPLDHHLGWKEGTEWVLPLTPQLALWLRRKESQASAPQDANWVANVNRRTVEQARRFVYARSPQNWVLAVRDRKS